MNPHHVRTFGLAILALLVGGLAGVEEAVAQQAGSGRAQVLVATFQTRGGVDDGFGEEIAERLREHVGQFDLLTGIDEDRREDALDQFELDHKKMDLISWRQLGNHLNAQLIVYGEIAPANSGGNEIDAVFVETDRGERTEVPTFTVQGDDDDAAEEAAREISSTLDRHVEFLRARLNCQDYLASDQFEGAIRNCDRALEIQPASPQALFLRAQVAVEQENWEAAIDYLERAVEENSSYEEAIETLAYAHAQAGNRDRSVERYQEYLEFNPGDQDVRLSVAYNLASADAYGAAMEILQEGLKRDSTSTALWRYLGDVALRQGTAAGEAQIGSEASITDTSAIRTALDAYRQYISLDPDSVSVSLYRNMTNIQQTLGRLDAGLELTSEALEAIEDSADRASLFSKRADLLAASDRLSRAVAAMDSVLAHDSTYQRARFKRGLFELRQGEREAAMQDFRAAVERGVARDDIGQSLFATGHSRYYQNGNYRQAAEIFEAALEFGESDQLTSQLHFWAGYSWFRYGRGIDDSNEEEACEPARRAQEAFERVPDHMQQAGDVQPDSQEQILTATDQLLYRQEQIQRKACPSD